MIYGLDLMIFCVRDEDLNNSEIGIPVDLDNCVLRQFTFYNINYVSKDKDNPQYTLIGSNGDEFLCDENNETVKQKIEQLKVLRFN